MLAMVLLGRMLQDVWFILGSNKRQSPAGESGLSLEVGLARCPQPPLGVGNTHSGFPKSGIKGSTGNLPRDCSLQRFIQAVIEQAAFANLHE